MEKTNYSELWTLLLPYALNTINAGAISGAPSPHALDSAHHSGALGLTQLPGLTVAAGAGLIGGGALETTGAVTLSVVGDATITVGADAIGINLGNANAWSALQTFNAGLAIGGGNALTLGGDVAISRTAANVLGLDTGDALRSSNYASGVSGWGINADGSAEFENVQIRGELRTTVLKFQEMQATAGTVIVSKSAGVLAADATTAASIGGSFTLSVKDSDAGAALFAVNDVLWIKTWTGAAIVSIYCTVTVVGSPSGGARNYTVTLNSGSTSTTVRAGTAVADYGPANTGAITLSADGAVGSSANISIVRHAGSPWSAQTLLARLGNLNGSYGLATDAHGIGLGDYAAGNYLVYDNSRGFEFRAGAGSVGIDASGIRLTKGSSSAVGALKFYDSTAFSSQVGGLSVDRGTFVDGLLSTDATAFDQYARTYLAAIGDTSAANSRREQYLEVNTGAGSRWGVIVYGGGTDAANGGGLQVSATDQGQVGIVPRGTITAQTALRVGSWASGVFDQSAFLASNALMVRGSSGSGYIYMTAPGEANRTGTVEWYRGDSTRHGYMGYSTPGSLDLVLENGSTLNVIGGAVDLNSGPIWSYDTTTASAAAGGGVVTAIGIADGQMWLVTVTGGDQNWRATVLLGCRSGSAHLHTITNTSICVPSVSSNTLRITNNDPTFSQAFYVRAIRLM